MPRSKRKQKHQRAELRAERWRVLLARQFNRCGICGNIFGSGKRTLDHVVPTAKGGGNVLNRVVAHEHCNNRKGDRMPTGCELVWLMVANAGRRSRAASVSKRT